MRTVNTKAKKVTFGKKGGKPQLSYFDMLARVNLQAAKRMGDFNTVRKIENQLRINF